MPLPAAIALGLLVSTAFAAESKPASTPSSQKATTKSAAKSTTSSKVAANSSTTSAPRKRAAPKPATVTPPEPEADATVQANDTPPAGTTNSEVMAEVVALRAEVVALKNLIEEQNRPPEPQPTPEEAARQRERERADERIVTLREQRQRLDDAIAAGLDSAVVAPAVERLDEEIRIAQDARLAIDAPPVAVAATVVPDEPETSLAFDLGVGSAYAFRGLNVFADTAMQDSYGVFSPTVSTTFAESGISLTWRGAFQLTGDNAAALVDAGVGARNELGFGWRQQVVDGVFVGAGATAYLFPFADADVAGVAAPIYVEPSVSAAIAKGVDLGLEVAAMLAVQDEVGATRYLYIHPTIGRTFELPGGFSLIGGFGGGGKVYFAPDAPTDNVWDASADLALSKTVAGSFYVRPSVHGAWTNLDGQSVGASTFGWFGVNVGATL